MEDGGGVRDKEKKRKLIIRESLKTHLQLMIDSPAPLSLPLPPLEIFPVLKDKIRNFQYFHLLNFSLWGIQCVDSVIYI